MTYDEIKEHLFYNLNEFTQLTGLDKDDPALERLLITVSNYSWSEGYKQGNHE